MLTLLSKQGAEQSPTDSNPVTASKYKCPWKEDKHHGCSRTFKRPSDLRHHYRSHSRVKPYFCTFQGCNSDEDSRPGFSQRSHVISHIRNQHSISSALEALKFMKVHRKLVDEESRLLGIRIGFEREVSAEGEAGEACEADDHDDCHNHDENDDDGDSNDSECTGGEDIRQLLLPQFDTIHRNAHTGNYVCPVKGCQKEMIHLSHLKKHYRILGSNYRPYQCIVDPVSCSYSAKQLEDVSRHIREVHSTCVQELPSSSSSAETPDNQIDLYSSLIECRTDLLALEDQLFERAQIVQNDALGVKRPCQYFCPFTDCLKAFPSASEVCRHYRIHNPEKPFSCAYPGCGQSSTQKAHMVKHILSAHFNIPWNEQKKLSAKQKQVALRYLEVLEDALAEQAVLAMARQQLPTSASSAESRQKRLGTNSARNTFNYENLNYDYLDEDGETTLAQEDEDLLHLPGFYPSSSEH